MPAPWDELRAMVSHGRVMMACVLLGAAAGVAWWYWHGCTNGCAITSTWWRSGLYGAAMGGLVAGLIRPERTDP